MNTTADSTPIDDAVIDGLRPQARRYDVAVSDELVLAVLPNGSKTWTWVYDGPGQPHRQTLGVYPEMSFEQARQALKSAQRTRRRRGAPAAYVIRDGRIEPSGRGIEWKWPLAGALALAAGGIALGWWLLGDSGPTPEEAIAAREPPTDTLTLDKRLDADRGRTTGPAATVEPEVAGASADPAPAAAAQPAPPVTVVPPAADTPPEAAPVDSPSDPPPAATGAQQTVEARVDTAPVDAQPEPTPAVTGARQTVGTPADTGPVDALPEPALAVTVAQQAVDTPAVTVAPLAVDIPAETGPADASPAPATAVAVQQAVDTPADAAPVDAKPEPATATTEDATDPSVGARITAGIDFEAGIADDRVARAHITSAVVNREPVDTLGPIVTGNGESIQTFNFFTELRSLSGQRVRHRWIAGDRIQAEIPFDVGEAWRWRIFSSKRLLASMAGAWRVQVVTDDDTVIYDYAFEFRP